MSNLSQDPPRAPRTFVMGDIHGAYHALVQVFKRANFDKQRDKLIFLGDVADGWPETKECVDFLLSLSNLVWLVGNHDEWTKHWLAGNTPDPAWIAQGGAATILSYRSVEAVPDSHRAFFNKAKFWHQEEDRMFVHGGWPWYRFPHPMICSADTVMWDRELWKAALQKGEGQLTSYREVYVGHTTTLMWGIDVPCNACEVWNMDQGAGYGGKLSLMDIDTKEYWQSDPVKELYPYHEGR